MFGISFEHLLVLGIILLFVGPRRLPELGHTLGKALKNFKDGVAGVKDASYRKLDEKEEHPETDKIAKKDATPGEQDPQG